MKVFEGKRVCAMAAATLVIVAACGFASAQAPLAAKPERFDDWRVSCPPTEAQDAACEITTDLIGESQRDGTVTAHAIITSGKDGKEVMNFTLPYGVALVAGMGLHIGQDPVRVFPFRTCNAAGCIAATTLGEDLFNALKNGDDAAIVFARLDGRAVSLPLSLKGLSAAHDEMVKRAKARPAPESDRSGH
jgi:invasion protein IalB